MDRVIAIDFDGTLCTNAWPAVGEPNWPVINHAKDAQAVGAKLILWTCREGEYLKAAIAACEKWGLHFDAVNANIPERIEEYGGDCRKVSADEYWDDRAVQFWDAVDWKCRNLLSTQCAWDKIKKTLEKALEMHDPFDPYHRLSGHEETWIKNTLAAMEIAERRAYRAD